MRYNNPFPISDSDIPLLLDHEILLSTAHFPTIQRLRQDSLSMNDDQARVIPLPVRPLPLLAFSEEGDRWAPTARMHRVPPTR